MATSAAVIIAKARRDVVSHFMQANALSADSAVAYEPGRRIRQRQFERLCDAGIIRSTGDKRFWIDAPRYDEWSRGRRKRIGITVGAIALIGGLIAAAVG